MTFITVAIPTYRRLPMLRRAIDSVFEQTFSEWEIVVSDDEVPPGDSWVFLRNLASTEPRVRPIMNTGPHGACSNHNIALRGARGEWIKILHDDDRLKPNCLETLAKIVKERPGVVAISCASEKFVDGKLASPFRRRDRAVLERLEPGDALLAMYVLDEAGWAPPTQQMVHRSVIDAGVLFEQPPGIDTLYDSWFNARVRARGPTLVYNVPLVEWHQGKHETTTSAVSQDQLTAEFVALRKLLLPLVPMNRVPPSLRTTEEMILLVRAISLVRSGQLREAIRIVGRIAHPRSYAMAVACLLRRRYPRRFSSIVRRVEIRDHVIDASPMTERR